MDLLVTEDAPPKPKAVVRLTTSYWFGDGAINVKKQIRLLKRKSIAFTDKQNAWEVLHEFLETEDIMRIVNLYDVEDGIYELDITNESVDWETGYSDDWDYVLIPTNG